MGTLLWNPVYVKYPTFCVRRAYISCFALGWVKGSFQNFSQPMRTLETVYGGYTQFFKLKPYVWAWSHKTFELQDIFEDVYAYNPGSTTPINCGTVYVDVRPLEPYGRYSIVVGFDIPDRYVYLVSMPGAPAGYWAKSKIRIPSTPIVYQASHPPHV